MLGTVRFLTLADLCNKVGRTKSILSEITIAIGKFRSSFLKDRLFCNIA